MKPSVLFLTLETFSRTGGIQRVCRSLAKALQQVSAKMMLYSVCDADEDLLEQYLDKFRFKGFRRNRLAFCYQTVRVADRYHTIVLAHINLLPIAYMIKLLYPSKQIILIAHGIEVWKRLGIVERYFLNRHTEIWAVSAFTRSRILGKNKLDPGQIKVLHNCLDPYFAIPLKFEKPVELLERYGICKDQPVILSVCRLSRFERKKGYDRVICAIPDLLKCFPTLRYYIAGSYDPEEKRRLELLIGELEITGHVHLLGMVDEKELSAHYQLADVFALPSQKEGFGLVLIEAAVCGCMVIGGNVDGSAEALLGGRIGRLIDPGRTDQLTRTLRYCLSDLSRIHAQQTQRLALQSFSFSNYLSNVQMLLS
jgi:glycosyltransferase involved in cell wall biosynthesis